MSHHRTIALTKVDVTSKYIQIIRFIIVQKDHFEKETTFANYR